MLDKALSNFEARYQCIAFYDLGIGKKIYIGNKDNGCRFCEKTTQDTSFKKTAHAVPEFLGNKQLILKNECDNCNELFSRLEADLDKLSKPYRISSAIKGKKKIPSHRSRDHQTRFDYKNEGVPVIRAPLGGNAKIDAKKGILEFKFDIESYIPVYVYKCLVKIGLSVIEEREMINFTTTKKWIIDLSNKHQFFPSLKIHKSYIPGPNPHRGKVVVSVFKKIEFVSKSPKYLMMLGFGNVSYQIILASDCDLWLINDNVTWNLIPNPFDFGWEYGMSKKSIIDMSSAELRQGEVDTIFYSGQINEVQDFANTKIEDIYKLAKKNYRN